MAAQIARANNSEGEINLNGNGGSAAIKSNDNGGSAAIKSNGNGGSAGINSQHKSVAVLGNDYGAAFITDAKSAANLGDGGAGAINGTGSCASNGNGGCAPAPKASSNPCVIKKEKNIIECSIHPKTGILYINILKIYFIPLFMLKHMLY